ncbi:hypothetical protein ACFQV8_21960 [Pseudonocardia benzenivorans]
MNAFSRVFGSRSPTPVQVRWQDGEPVEFQRRPVRKGPRFLVTDVRERWIEESRGRSRRRCRSVAIGSGAGGWRRARPRSRRRRRWSSCCGCGPGRVCGTSCGCSGERAARTRYRPGAGGERVDRALPAIDGQGATGARVGEARADGEER